MRTRGDTRRAWLVPLLLVGCEPTGLYQVDAPIDADPGDVDLGDAPHGERLDYVIDAWVVATRPIGPQADIAPGFDLDGVVSDGLDSDDPCGTWIPDLRSPAGELGIDNRLTAALIALTQASSPTFDLEPQLEAEIANGSNVLALRVTDLDALREDDDLTITLQRVRPLGCAAPCAVADVRAVTAWVPEGAPVVIGRGSTASGILEARFESFPLVFTDETRQDIPLRDARLRCRFVAGGLGDCVLGGALAIDDLAAFAESRQAGAGELFTRVLADYADLSPSSSEPRRCTRLSAGLELTAVSASIE